MESSTSTGIQHVEDGKEFPQFNSDNVVEPSEGGDGQTDRELDEGEAVDSTDALRGEAVSAVGRGSDKAQDLADATAWFLSDEPTPLAVRTFGLNVGKWNDEKGAYEDFVVNWTVQAISREKIRSIQRMSLPAKRRATGGDPDSMKANLGIAAEGTTTPDLREIAAEIGTQDVGEVLKRRFAYKPGLIDQIASEVLTVSGYDEDDVRDVAAVRD